MVWLNNHKPHYMDETEKIVLSVGQIQNSVVSLNYSGLQIAAATGIYLMSKLLELAPAQISKILEE